MNFRYKRGYRFDLTFAIAFALVGGQAGGVAFADENGISFWLPGMYGSMAATPLQPGLSIADIYYHTSVSASGATAAQREIEVGRLGRTANLSLDVNLHADVDRNIINPILRRTDTCLGRTTCHRHGRNSRAQQDVPGRSA
jgi:hypothetical protein